MAETRQCAAMSLPAETSCIGAEDGRPLMADLEMRTDNDAHIQPSEKYQISEEPLEGECLDSLQSRGGATEVGDFVSVSQACCGRLQKNVDVIGSTDVDVRLEDVVIEDATKGGRDDAVPGNVACSRAPVSGKACQGPAAMDEPDDGRSCCNNGGRPCTDLDGRGWARKGSVTASYRLMDTTAASHLYTVSG